MRSWWLGKKKGKEAWVRPIVVADPGQPSGRRVEFEIGHGAAGVPGKDEDGTVGRNGATCVACGSAVALDYVRAEGQDGRIATALLATVAEGVRRRVYIAPTEEHRGAARVAKPLEVPDGELGYDPRAITAPNYGMTRWADLFTNRQLLALTTFSDLVVEARERVLRNSLTAGARPGDRLEAGGTDAEAYTDAVATYLSFAVSRLSSTNSALCRWNSAVSKESVSDTFARPALPMMWDFAEGDPFCAGPCELTWSAGWIANALERAPASHRGRVFQADASVGPLGGALISTDPPYYDNIGYSDLSDFFYVWLRRSLRSVHTNLLSTMLVPKAEELVANPYRNGSKDGAREFFEKGFRRVFARARETALPHFPITVYYAFKQSDAGDDGTASTGWETLLDGMIRSGWAITATWPMRSERGGRMRDVGANALASAIVLALRPRPEDASTTDRRGLIAALHAELPDALRKLQQGTIAPVDLPQAAIGPGMAVFSRYARVIENDGTTMTVRSALARINEILDQVLNEQEGDFDAATRFAIAWYRQHGYTTGKFGVADDLARARNTAVETMVRDGILTSTAGKVALLSPPALPQDYNVLADDRVGAWEVLHYMIAFLERDGLPAAGAFLASAQARPDGAIDIELVKELAFLLFAIAEKNSWTQDALAFNTVATAWPDIVQAGRSMQTDTAEQSAFEFEEG